MGWDALGSFNVPPDAEYTATDKRSPEKCVENDCNNEISIFPSPL